MKRPVIFGEILFDCFPDGSSVCSGAPLNVCRNLKYLGYEPLMISRVGTDVLGDTAIRELTRIGLDVSGIQRDDLHPTSQATVSIVDDEPSYHFTPDSAWDHIDADHALQASQDVDIAFLYTGTLALRSAVSLAALQTLFDHVSAPLFFDANLRTPWWQRELVNDLLKKATWLKCNDEEYQILFADVDPETVRSENNLDVLILTQGEKGATIYAQGEQASGRPPPLVEPLMDTVGAGDAFASMVIKGLDQGKALHDVLNDALALSAKVCSFRGADWQSG